MFMCVGTMDGFSERGDWSSEDMATWPSASEDELDIVGKATVDDSVDDDLLDFPSPSVPHCPIVECMGLSKASWMNLEVVLVNDSGVAMADGICRNTHPQD